MKNQHKKSRNYLNMEIPLEKLARPRTKSEKARYARRLEREREKILGDHNLNPMFFERMTEGLFIYQRMTTKGKRLNDKMSHDYLNQRIPFDNYGWLRNFGWPRTDEERVLFRYRYNAEQLIVWEDTFEDDYYDTLYADVKVMDQKGNILTNPVSWDEECNTNYLDMEHPLTFDWYDVPRTHCELKEYNRRVELDPALTEADKLIEIPWPDKPQPTYIEKYGVYELMTPEERDIQRQKNEELPKGTYKVIGLGACGIRAVDYASLAGIWDVEPVAMDMEWKPLETSKAPRTRWLWQDAEDGEEPKFDPWENVPQDGNEDTIRRIIDGENTIILALGLGGRGGTQTMPLLLSVANGDKLLGPVSYVIGMATLPFAFEAKERKTAAAESLAHLSEKADAVFVLPGDVLLDVANRDFPLLADFPADKEWTPEEAFRLGTRVLGHSVTAMTALLAAPEDPDAERKNLWNGLNPLMYETHREPLSDAFGPNAKKIQTLMKHSIPTAPGIGESTGEKAVEEAAKHAVASLLLGDALEKAVCVLVHVMCASSSLNPDITSSAVDIVRKNVCNDVSILSGASGDDMLNAAVRVTVFAIVPDEEKREAARQAQEEKQEASRQAEQPKSEEERRAERKEAGRLSKYRGRTILKWTKIMSCNKYKGGYKT